MSKFYSSQTKHTGILYTINLGLSGKRVTQLRYTFATFVSIFLIYFSQTSQKETEFVRSYAIFACNKIIDVFYSPITLVKYTVNFAKQAVTVYEENEKLKAENKKMEEYMILKELERHKEYDTLNLIKKNAGISKNLRNFEISYISIESGMAILKTNGIIIKENASVLCSAGLAGRVVLSDGNIAKVILINDEKSFIPITTSITAAKGVLKNDVDVGLEIIGLSEKPKIGEIVYTMSPEHAFLAGVPIGIVYRSDNEKVLVKAICDASKSNFLSVFVE